MAQLVTGNDLMKVFNLTPGPIVGKLLESVKEAQFQGKIKTRHED